MLVDAVLAQRLQEEALALWKRWHKGGRVGPEPYNPMYFGADRLDSYITDRWMRDEVKKYGIPLEYLSPGERDQLRCETFIKVLFVQLMGKNPMPALAARKADDQEQIWIHFRLLPIDLAFHINFVVHAKSAAEAALVEDIHRYRDTHGLETILDTQGSMRWDPGV